MNQKNLLEVDWSQIPAPKDDGAANHLVGTKIPPVSLVATDDRSVTLSALPGRSVVFAYPRTGEPGKISLVDDWDMIPGARGCTPQTCSFRDLFAELKAAGAQRVFGLSTQSNAYQLEMASRLHLPFSGAFRRQACPDARLEPADHGGRGPRPDQAACADH
jgi:peroxiredoxin